MHIALNYFEQEIIRNAATTQVQSLVRVWEDKTTMLRLLDLGIDVSLEDQKSAISSLITTFSKLIDDPELIHSLGDAEKSLFIHQLTNMDESTISEDHRPRLYRLMFTLREFKQLMNLSQH